MAHTPDRSTVVVDRSRALPARDTYPLGPVVTPEGTRFSVHAPHAERVEVCLVDDLDDHRRPGDHRFVEHRVELPGGTDGVWTGTVPGIGPGARYGYRVHGPWRPELGIRTNPDKILLDPWARRMVGDATGGARLHAHAGGDPFGDRSTVDSLGHTPLSVVTDPLPGARVPRPSVPWSRTVLYELHVGSYTARHPDVPPHLRGTYLGLAHPAVVEHLVSLGVTSVELLPVHASVTEPPVRERGMHNHWGYSTASFFAPHAGYATAGGDEIAEFAAMVDALHSAGLEVVLDVVYNHTCEWSVEGPSLCWRGLDGPGYYLLDHDPHSPRAGRDIDLTGCGNTVDATSPVAVRMITDSLRYWATEFAIDGFRFDLAPVLGRPGGGAFDPRAAALTAIATDPVIGATKLIAEPWDATAEGHSTGAFGPPWAQWNDRFRDDVRRFWAHPRGVRDLASRVAGSADLVHSTRPGAIRRGPLSSVNFVTAHDGFTLADLVSYRHKHNGANGEDNRDGSDHNLSVNHGVEGPTDDPAVVAARDRHRRALLATLLLSAGVPMLRGGDELRQSQGGNNNAYAVPAGTPVADRWPLEWPTDAPDVAYVRRLLRLRAAAPMLQRHTFFDGRAALGRPDLLWFDEHGREFDTHRWHDETATTLQAWVQHPGDEGDDPALVVVHAGGPADVVTPFPDPEHVELIPVFDSSTATGAPALPRGTAGEAITVDGPTVAVFRVGRPRR